VGSAGPTPLIGRPGLGIFLKSIFNTCQPKSARRVSNVGKAVLPQSLVFVLSYIVELVFVLSYIRSRVWGSIKYSGTRCGDYSLIPRRLTTLFKQKILDSVIDVVSEALSTHVTPPAIWIIVVPIGVTVLLGLYNSPHSWIDTVGPSLPGLTIAPCVDSLLCNRLICRSKSILQDSPKI
jgi:hypothetical protein